MKLLVIGLGRINIKNKDGGAIRLFNVLRHLIQRGVSVDVLIPKRDLRNFHDYRVKANFHLLSDPRWMRNSVVLLYGWRIIHGLLFVLGYKNKVDIVYSASDFWHDFLPALTYKLKNPSAKLVICLFLMAPPPWKRYEDMYTSRISFPRLWTAVFYITQRFTILLGKFFCDGFFVLNERDKEKLVSFGASKEKIFVVSMGIDMSKKIHKEIAKKYEGIFLGRLHPQKGLSDLLAIWQKVVTERPKAKLVIIGGGSSNDMRKLLKDIKRRRLTNNINYLGYLDGQQKIRVLLQSKVMLMPSHYESWGQVIVEGLAARLPVVAYNLPIFYKIFGENVVLVNLYDINEFSRAVLNLLSDSSKNFLKSDRDISSVRIYSWDNVGEHDYLNLKSFLHDE